MLSTNPQKQRMLHQIREAYPGDLPFLRAMLYEAAYWRPDAERPDFDIGLQHPELVKWFAAWGKRHGDTAVIAVTQDNTPVGAAWYRFWTEDNHSYGYVDEPTPELGIGVVREYRRQGIGRDLLRALLDRARASGLQRVSLSVETDNPAQHLYTALGFRTVGTLGTAYTMLADL